jgi:transglutaminase-like putative cysteine protease
MLHVHSSRTADLREPDEVHVTPGIPPRSYTDSFGNRCSRFLAIQGQVRFSCATLIENSGDPDASDLSARAHSVEELPDETLIYPLNSRYCEVDRLSRVALDLFGNTTPGWARVAAICDWVYSKVTTEKILQPETASIYLYIRRLSPFY